MAFTQPTEQVAAPQAPPIPQQRKYGQPGQSSWFKPVDYLGNLVLITPKSVQQVTKPPRKPGEEPKVIDQLTADVVVLDGPRAGESLKGVWIENTVMVDAGKKALANGEDTLGRIRRVAQKRVRDQYPTWQDVEAEVAKSAGHFKDYAWVLENFTDHDASLADAYLSGRAPVPEVPSVAPTGNWA